MKKKHCITASLLSLALMPSVNSHASNWVGIAMDARASGYTSTTKLMNPDQQTVVKGKVTDQEGSPLPGVSVVLKGTKIATTTNASGEFALNFPHRNNISLVFSYIGMKSITKEITDPAKYINVQLQENSTQLNEVVATGMQRVKRERMTGSVSVLTAKDLKGQGITSIDRILDGMIPGLNSTSLSGAPGTRSQIAIRGENSLNGNTEPLWIVDGLPLLEGVPQNNSGNYAATIMQDGIGNILPEDIESITILKDASAAAIYGARAANGVIVITTKKGFRSKTQISYNGTYDISTAPRIDLNMMNSEEKLRYEKSIIDYFGPKTAFNTGRGSLLYKLQTGYISNEAYENEMNRLRGINTDWFKEIFRTAQSQQHSVNLRGGSEQLTYYTTINFTDKRGILESNHYKNAGIFIRMDYRPVKNLIFGLDVSANTRSNQEQASAIDPFKYAAFANPYERPFNDAGEYDADLSYLSNNYTSLTPSGYVYDKFNIIKEMRNNILKQTGVDVAATFNVRYEPMKGLIFNLLLRKTAGYNYGSTEIDAGTYTSWITEQLGRKAYPGALILPKEYDNGELRESSGRSSAWTGRLQADYSYLLRKSHLFSVMAAMDFSSRSFNSFGYTSPIYYSDYRITGFPAFNTPSVNFKDLYNMMGNFYHTSDGQDRSLSYIANLRYGYKDRYILNLNGRLDGADVIGNKNQFTPLWSVGGRYNVYKEPFFKLKFVSDLALRASYGYTGQIDRNAYPFSVIELGSTIYMGNRIVDRYQFPNPTVKWARKRDLDLGIDLGFYHNRISFTADYYSNETKDILTNLNVPNSTGRTNVYANGGIVKNRGFELSTNVIWVESDRWMFSTRFNIATNHNTIVRSLHNFKSIQEMLNDGRVVLGGVYDIEGEETGGIYGWKTAGINPDTGNPRYYLTPEGKAAYKEFLDNYDTMSKADKEFYDSFLPNKTEVPDYVDFPSGVNHKKDPWQMPSMQYLGRTNPKLIGGFSTYVRYKNFEFTTNWTFKTGHLVPTFNDYQNAPRTMSGTASQLIAQGYTGDLAVSVTNRQKKYLNYWQQPGDHTNVRRFVSNGNDLWASFYTSNKYEKGDYLRLNSASFSYRFAYKLISKYKLNNLVLSLNARNLVTFTKYRGIDVATGRAFSYPAAKEFSVRLTVGF